MLTVEQAREILRMDTAEGALNRVDRVVVRWDLPQRDMYLSLIHISRYTRQIMAART